MAGPRIATPAAARSLGAIPKNSQPPQEAIREAWRSTATSASQGTKAAADVNDNLSKGNASHGTSATSASWGNHATATKGTKRPHQAPPATASTSRQAYSAAAATSKDKKYLIHVYETRDKLRPFRYEEEFCLFRDTVKAAIWEYFELTGPHPDLAVKDWSYHRSGRLDEGIGIIYCTSPSRQARVIKLIVQIGLGIHIVETVIDIPSGMKMSFKKPRYGPQNIVQILEAIFVCKGLEGPDHCGSREERTDTPRTGLPYKVCTVHFPQDVVEFAEQRDYPLDGPDGLVSFYGKEVAKRKRAAFEAKVAQDAAAAVAATQAIQPPEEGDFSLAIVAAALADAYEAGRTATLPTEAVDAPETPEGTILMAPYPTILVRAINIAARLGRQKPPQRALEAEFVRW
jgi:hypothetical protein